MAFEASSLRDTFHVAMQVGQDLAGAIASGHVEDVRSLMHAAVRTLSNRTSNENDNKEVRLLAYTTCCCNRHRISVNTS